MALWHCGMWRPRCPKTARSNQSASKITASSVVYYVSVEFDEFVLKIDPIRRPKFGTSKKMLYLCTRNMKLRVRVKAAAQHSSSELGSAFALHFTCSCVRTNKAVSGGPMQIVAKYLIPCKNTFKHYGKDFV